MKREIIPIILAKNFADFKKKLSIIKNLKPKPKIIQIDITDGKFTHFTIFDESKKAAPLLQNIKFEVHLMVMDPEQQSKAWIKAGAQRIIFHLEPLLNNKNKLLKTIRLIRAHHIEIGLGLTLETPISALEPYIGEIDYVLLLSVRPGQSGQTFQESVLPKIRDLHQRHPPLPIEVDGGVKLNNAGRIFKAGATTVSVASAILSATDPQLAYKTFLKLAI